MQKPYHDVLARPIYFSGASPMQQIADEEHIDVMVDLREESTGCPASNLALIWQKIPPGNNADQPPTPLFKDVRQRSCRPIEKATKWLSTAAASGAGLARWPLASCWRWVCAPCWMQQRPSPQGALGLC